VRSRSIALALSLSLTTLSAGALAQTGGEAPPAGENAARLEQAREHYRNGVAAFRARRFGDAVVEFERSYRLRPHPATLYNAAEARLRAGDRERAVEQLRELLAMTSPAPDAATIERARVLAREAGVEDLQPAPREECPVCPVCPVCPPPRECPTCPPPRVVVPDRGPLPWVLAGGGAVALVAGVGFYSVALADAATYQDQRLNSPMGLELRRELRDQGEAFRWVGLAGILVGLGAEAGAVYLLTRPPTASERATQSARPAAPIARVGVAPAGVVVSGTF
jgi:tetratricopeptide (TPR) repeat protein